MPVNVRVNVINEMKKLRESAYSDRYAWVDEVVRDRVEDVSVDRLRRAGDLRHRVRIVRDRLDNPLVDRAWIDDDEEAESDKCGDTSYHQYLYSHQLTYQLVCSQQDVSVGCLLLCPS